jgi:hypothetical protein
MALATITIATSSNFGGTTQNVDFVGVAPPAVPVQGTRWWNSETGRMYMYYVDANTSQWVEV